MDRQTDRHTPDRCFTLAAIWERTAYCILGRRIGVDVLQLKCTVQRDRRMSYSIISHVPSLVLIAQAVFLLERGHTYTVTDATYDYS